jgi:coenzyme F420 biosynthesis associated uncharacterized protein
MLTSSNRSLGRTLTWGVILGMGAFAMHELVRPRPRNGALVDWEHVERIALERCREGPGQPPMTEATQRYAEMATDLQAQMAEFDPSMARDRLPAFQAIGRREWVRVNIGIFQALFEPLESLDRMVPGSLLLQIGRRGISEYAGTMLGILARRVLGQYDPALLGREPVVGGALYLVEPNIVAWQQLAKVPPEELRRWLALHEMTHAWEFQAHPWLRDYLEGLLRSVLLGRLADGRAPQRIDLLRAFTIGWSQQWDALRKLQAAMCLLEGYSNLIMNEVGRRHLPHFDRLEQAYRARLRRRSPLERILYKVTGLEMKLQQYIQGERFCNAVRAAGGQDLLARLWEGPETLPSLPEIQSPQRWIQRARGAPAGPAMQPSSA